MSGRVLQLILYVVVCATIPVALHIPKVLGDESRATYVAKYRCDLATAIIRGTPPHRPRDKFGPRVNRDPEVWRTETLIAPTTFVRLRRPKSSGWDVTQTIHQFDASGIRKDVVSVEDRIPFDPKDCGMPFDRTLEPRLKDLVSNTDPYSRHIDEYVFHDFAVEPLGGAILIKFDYYPARSRLDYSSVLGQSMIVRASPSTRGWTFEQLERNYGVSGWHSDASGADPPSVRTMLQDASSQKR